MQVPQPPQDNPIVNSPSTNNSNNNNRVISRVLSLLKDRRVQIGLAVLLVLAIVGNLVARNSYDPAYFSFCSNPQNVPASNGFSGTSGRILPIDADKGQIDSDVSAALPAQYRASPGQVDLVACIHRSTQPSYNSNQACKIQQALVGLTFYDAARKTFLSGYSMTGQIGGYSCEEGKTEVPAPPISASDIANYLASRGSDFVYSSRSYNSYYPPYWAAALSQIAALGGGLLLALVLLRFILAPTYTAAGWALRNPTIYTRIFSVALGMALSTVTFGLFPVLAWISALAAYFLDRADKKRSYRFRKYSPFYVYGAEVEAYQMVFGRKEDDMDGPAAAKLLSDTLNQTLDNYIGTEGIAVNIVDIAKNYEKVFVQVQHITHLETTVSVIFNLSYHMESFRLLWFSLVRGKVKFWWHGFWFAFYAPFTIFSWGWPALRGIYSVRAAISAAIDYTYDHFDINGWLDIFQQRIFDGLLIELDKAGFDVEYYKRHPMNFINNSYTTNISGAGASIGVLSMGNNNTNNNNTTNNQNTTQQVDSSTTNGTPPIRTRPLSKRTAAAGAPDIDDPFAPMPTTSATATTHTPPPTTTTSPVEEGVPATATTPDIDDPFAPTKE